jgi:GntR family transcriptional regulator
MFFQVDASSDLPIYDQVVRQVKYAVANGTLAAGDLIPSVRDLACELAVNPNTVVRAYQLLQSDGVIKPLRGKGMAVMPGSARHCRAARDRLIDARIRQVLIEALQSGLGSERIAQIVLDQLATLSDST